MESKKPAELLKGIWENLTDEQKEKVKACKTDDELIKLAGEEGIELPDEVLDAVAGGVIVNIHDGTFSAFDSDGQYIGNTCSRAEAEEMARQRGASTAEVDYNGLQMIRQEAYERKNKTC